MTEYQKRHIAVSPQQRLQLEESKRSYERRAGRTDWGSFLRVATGIGLAALGVYFLARASRQNTMTWHVTCPNQNCRAVFPIVAELPPRLAQVTCPHCNSELIVDFGAAVLTNGQHPSAAPRSDNVVNLYCAHCRQQMQMTIPAGFNPQGVEYLQCPFCGGVATYGIGEVEQQP